MLVPILAICVGASIGALSRWGLALWLGVGGLMPWGTLAANLIGGYLVGLAVATFQLLPNLDPVWRLALVTGFLGGLTTFSSFSAEVTTMLLEGRLGVALVTAAAHLGGSLCLTWLGIRTVQVLSA
ncbi:protein CrcB [Variovorax paradoxus]|jgi:CrcB protein|uniref:fluoride efflux transporter CrcB n=1 Tax=Variovorax TaxID=34072 RepID=UPI0006E517AA|nr:MULTISPECIES: fluoride efflux transporter CrcB [unclassified Variovorax]KPU96298.1 protein CrcB [Variovorax paradoxus]KPV08488.1 protein CrcB [Variovorax paradoxus]KPV13680.1 protein CrcB [Variovorax paradoxus]KPV14168.1 protein CrcB [Variovorax paradoxus]KPV36522.1 protein CrcB [Variovorax paradoxus]